MNWDDLRYVLALARSGSLARAGRVLKVDHTTVGRRIDAAEAALGVRLFTRTTTGYVATAEGERLLSQIRDVEEAVLTLERGAHAEQGSLEGTVRVTSPETFGIAYLAPRLGELGRQHPGLTLELITGGAILDLGRREADIAVRFFRSPHESLVVRRVAEITYGLYASKKYLARRPVTRASELRDHPLLGTTAGSGVESSWIERLAPETRPVFVTELSVALLAAARAGAGMAVLPLYLGDAEPTLRHIPMPDQPTDPVWLTVHRDIKDTPRVRMTLDFLGRCLESDRALLRGR